MNLGNQALGSRTRGLCKLKEKKLSKPNTKVTPGIYTKLMKSNTEIGKKAACQI